MNIMFKDLMDNKVPIMIYLLLEEDERRNQMRLYRRNLRDAQNPFEVLTEVNFKKCFRFSKELAQLLIDQLEPHMVQIRTSGIPAFLKILATLYFLGHGSYQHSAGMSSVTALSQPSISRAVTIVCRLITELLMPEWIQFPTTNEQRTRIKQEKNGFRGIIGCIDGTHVEIIAPPVTDLDHPNHLYINRKGVHSINVMLICDSNCNIIACDARYPGSVHDSAIWNMSDIKVQVRANYDNGDVRTRLIGDSGYGLAPWLFTPFARVEPGTPEANYNNLLCSTRNCIERTNGILKGRFRSLLRHRVLHYSPDKAAYIIYAASVLHNIAQWANLEFNDEDYAVEENLLNNEIRQQADNDILQLGRAARAEYIRLHIHRIINV